MKVNDNFFIKLNEVCSRLGINPADLLLVMYLESGVDPSKKNNAGSGAVGLIQFMPKTLEDLGLDKNQVNNFGNRSSEDQLDFVEKYIRGAMSHIPGGVFKSATQYYCANLYPRTLSRWNGDNPEQNKNVIVLGETQSPETDPKKRAQEAQAYRANKYLDPDNKGYITVGDIKNKLNALKQTNGFQLLLKKLNEANNYKETINLVSQIQNKSTNQNINQLKQPEISKNKEDFWSWLSTNLSKFVSALGFGEKMAHSNNFLISLGSDADYTSSFEYARILCSALKEELNFNSSIYSDGNLIEIVCNSNLNKLDSFNKIKNVCDGVKEAFQLATKKIGTIKPHFIVIAGVKSDLNQVSLNKHLMEYRKFQYKIVTNNKKLGKNK